MKCTIKWCCSGCDNSEEHIENGIFESWLDPKMKLTFMCKWAISSIIKNLIKNENQYKSIIQPLCYFLNQSIPCDSKEDHRRF